ncbi:FG-GAP-like repeat-containing protein [Cryomorphaceae bacterium 1068]|nr:FG-GAP-like repeat-containing protein [Cryomorphaceae bacterium 1068]
MKKIYLSLLTIVFAGALNAQNSCAEALEIQAGIHTVDTVDGTEIPNPICAQNGNGADNGEWYKYQPTDTFNLEITTDLVQNSGGDTRFHVYTGDCNDLVCVAGDDDGGDVGNGYLSTDELVVYPENVYYIAFDDRWNPNGFDFELIEVVIVPPAPAVFSFTPEPLNLDGTLRGAVDMDGDFLDDVVSIETNAVNIALQSDFGLLMASLPSVPALYSPSWSMAAGDVDGNGWNDLVYGAGSGASIMFRADDGASFDEQVTSDFYLFSQRSNMVDINNDGNLDVFVCHDVEPNTYFLNQGDGTMDFIQGGLGDDDLGGNYGSIWTDYDNDGDIDMFIAKCRGGENVIKINEMHRNNGDGTYTEVGEEIGLADPVQTWSSAWGDYDNDGDMDVFVGASSFSDGSHKMMVNNGDGTFSDMTAGTGLEALAGTSIEWVTHDFDNDGYLDIMGGGGNILQNNGDMTFTETEIEFFNGPVGDLNNDGFLDVISNGQIQFNDGNDNNYLVVNTIGTESNLNGIGARITVYTESFSQIREIRSGDGFRYMSSLNAYFGLGQDSEIDSVVVSWPSGIVDVIEGPAINTSLTVTEGANPLSIESEIQSTLKVYPNPAINELFIEASENLIGSRVDIFDVQGKRVQSGILNANRIDVSSLETGNYILQIVFGEVAVESKFYKK